MSFPILKKVIEEALESSKESVPEKQLLPMINLLQGFRIRVSDVSINPFNKVEIWMKKDVFKQIHYRNIMNGKLNEEVETTAVLGIPIRPIPEDWWVFEEDVVLFRKLGPEELEKAEEQFKTKSS